jgi:transcriptional regulator with XRE-family HTH domain
VNEDHVAETLRSRRRAAGLTLRDLARRAGTSHSALAAYESAGKIPRADTFVRILDAMGDRLTTERQPFAGSATDRGRELAEVLSLAEQFPARPHDRLDFPRFGAPP